MEENIRLLPNREADLDTVGFPTTKAKAELLKDFLEKYPDDENQIKMIALYGSWGCGKSSIQKWLSNNLEDTFHCIYFNAWECEKDTNLSLSLFDLMCECIQSDTKIGVAKGKVKTFFKGIARAASFNLGIIKLSGKELVDTADAEEKEEKSFYTKKIEFVKTFQEIENVICDETKKERILIFLDDLDRCEPSNILNLLTTIKLFFTFGKRSLYFCGIDRHAVDSAIKIRYSDQIKAEEYLEKIFDISFTVPENIDVRVLIETTLSKEVLGIKIPATETVKEDDFLCSIHDNLTEMFAYMKFSNPRKVKKVLNKLVLLIKIKQKENAAFDNLIPKINFTECEGTIYHLLFTTFIITLFLFDKERFYELEDYDAKIIKYISVAINASEKKPGQLRAQIVKFLGTESAITFNLSPKLLIDVSTSTPFFGLLTHSSITRLSFDNDHIYPFIEQFNNSDGKYVYGFCSFLSRVAFTKKEKNEFDYQIKEVFEDEMDYPFFNLFEMAELFL